MEASSGLNPASSQGYLEVSSVEAKSMAKAGLIDVGSMWRKNRATRDSERSEQPSLYCLCLSTLVHSFPIVLQQRPF